MSKTHAFSKISWILLIFLFPAINHAQDNFNYSILTLSKELTEDANAVVRYDIGSFEVKSPGDAIAKYKLAVTRLNEKAGYKELIMRYDQFEKVKGIKIKLYDQMGNLIRKVGKDEIQDVTASQDISDARAKVADLSYSKYPYTIEYEYEIVYSGIFRYPSWYFQPYRTSVQKSEFTLKVPSSIEVKTRLSNIEIVPEEINADGFIIKKWTAENLKPIKSEPYVSWNDNILPQLNFIPNDFEIDDYRGSMATWEDFGHFMFELNKNHNNLTPEMKLKVAQMVEGIENEEEKIVILYKYIQDNMRYVSIQLGVGGWRAFDAAYVEKNKYGDCKALTWFMKSMLSEVGIESYPALVLASNEYGASSHPEDFSLPQFNHVILNVPSEDIWLECTSHYCPPNYLGSFTDDRSVMFITEEGGKLGKTPTMSMELNSETSQTKIILTANGAATVDYDWKGSGLNQEYPRQLKTFYSQEEIEDWFLENAALPSFTIENLELATSMDTPTSTMNYKVKVAKYASKAGKRMFLPINSINLFDHTLPKNDERKNPIQIKRSYQEEDRIEFEIPEGYKVESIPQESIDLSSDYGSYAVKITKDETGKSLKYHRHLKIKAVKLPPEKYNELRDFYKEIAKADKMKIVLVQKRT